MRDLETRYDSGSMHGPTSFVGPAYRMVKSERAYGPLLYEKVADRAVLERVRDAGYEYEGYVRIKGKRYSAFTSGGENPDGGNGCIIVRGPKTSRTMR